MKSLNKHMIIGNLGQDPQVSYTPGGTAVVNFSIATSSRVKNASGAYEDRTEWHNVTAFGKTAEFVGEFLKKGRQVYVEGPSQTESWEDKKTGEKKYKTVTIANELVALGKGEGRAATAASDDSLPY